MVEKDTAGPGQPEGEKKLPDGPGTPKASGADEGKSASVSAGASETPPRSGPSPATGAAAKPASATEPGSPSKPGSSTKTSSTAKPGATAKQDTAAKPTPPGGRAPKKSRRRGKTIFVLLLILAVIGGVLYAWAYHNSEIRSRLSFLPLPPGDPGIAAIPSPTPSPSPQRPDQGAPPAGQRDESAAPAGVESSATALPSPAESQQLRQSLDAVSSRSEAQAEELRILREQLADVQLTLNSQQQRLQALATTTREDWLLAEAEYLLRLANQRVLTEQQSRNALSLLEAADGILKDLDDPDLYPVRRSLAADITSLRSADVVDREGIYLRLGALKDLIPELDITTAEVPDAPAAEPVSDPSQPWYRRLAANAWQALKNLSGIVRVEKVEVATEPPLLPSEADMLRLNLRMALEQAQLSLMREQQAIFARSLEDAQQLVENRFESNDASRLLLEDLNALRDRRIVAELPAVTGSIRALHDYMSRWHDRYRLEEPEETPEPQAPTGSADSSVEPSSEFEAPETGGQQP